MLLSEDLGNLKVFLDRLDDYEGMLRKHSASSNWKMTFQNWTNSKPESVQRRGRTG